jgi:glycosyltransferase involved in cell wall biosynthesis
MRKLSLLFLAPGDVSKGRVEPISWMRTCEAFAARGFDVTLLALGPRNTEGVPRSAVWRHFDVAPIFRLRVAPSPLPPDASDRVFRVWAASAASVAAASTLVSQIFRPRPRVVYFRTPVQLAPFVLARRLLPTARRPVLVFETHALPPRSTWRLIRGADVIVANSLRLADDLRCLAGVPSERIVHAPLGPFNRVDRHPRNWARARLGLPSGARIACYTGKHVEAQNEFLLRAAREAAVRVSDFKLLLVGGNKRILAWTARRIEELGLRDTVLLPGFVPPADISIYQAAADVLVFHMDASLRHFNYCTPAKGFEYQAAGRPIVATEIPLYEEVFGKDGERAFRVSERTPKALAEGIARALSLDESSRAMSERAAAFVHDRTWSSRVDRVIGALGHVQRHDSDERAVEPWLAAIEAAATRGRGRRGAVSSLSD